MRDVSQITPSLGNAGTAARVRGYGGSTRSGTLEAASRGWIQDCSGPAYTGGASASG